MFFLLLNSFPNLSHIIIAWSPLTLVSFLLSTWLIHFFFQFSSISFWNNKSNKVLPKQIQYAMKNDDQAVHGEWCPIFPVYKDKDILAYLEPFLLPRA